MSKKVRTTGHSPGTFRIKGADEAQSGYSRGKISLGTVDAGSDAASRAVAGAYTVEPCGIGTVGSGNGGGGGSKGPLSRIT